MGALAVQYVKWANKTDLDDFWTDPKVKRLYKNHIYAMTSRTNVYNGERLCPCRPPVVSPHQGSGTQIHTQHDIMHSKDSRLQAENAADAAAGNRHAAARAAEESLAAAHAGSVEAPFKLPGMTTEKNDSPHLGGLAQGGDTGMTQPSSAGT